MRNRDSLVYSVPEFPQEPFIIFLCNLDDSVYKLPPLLHAQVPNIDFLLQKSTGLVPGLRIRFQYAGSQPIVRRQFLQSCPSEGFLVIIDAPPAVPGSRGACEHILHPPVALAHVPANASAQVSARSPARIPDLLQAFHFI